jgi:hypothetical protein
MVRVAEGKVTGFGVGVVILVVGWRGSDVVERGNCEGERIRLFK